MKQPNGRHIDDFFRLFVKREWKVVLGRGYSNLWLLVAMLTATFLAIAFSSASLEYLSEKMNDPFIKWVDIKNSYGEGDFIGLENALNDPENSVRFDYNSYQSDYYFSYMFFGREGNALQYFQCRFFQDLKSDLVAAILSDENVVDGQKVPDLDALPDETAGLILTRSALSKLGYERAPAYLDLCHYSVGADSLGFSLYDNEFARIPIPVLGVVKRLPSNVDIISTKYFYEQENNDNTYPFNLSCHRSYSTSLRYFLPETVDEADFERSLGEAAAALSSVPFTIDAYSFYKPEIIPFLPGRFVSLVGESEAALLPFETTAIHEKILAQWGAQGVQRVFDYQFSPYEVSEKTYLSVYFNKLNNIRSFEQFVNEYNVKIDMSQINSKENYNAVSIMANILSWAIIVFAIVCIILFIVDLLKSYFQKVKRNIGTFKAFGVSNRRVTDIYVLIVGVTIVIAILISLCITGLVQNSLAWMGFLKEGTYNYLDLATAKTAATVFIIIIASLATVYGVMGKLLKQTPGDLIYDRQ